MSGTLPDGIGQETVTVRLTRAEWGVVTAALYEAHMPMKLTGPVVVKLQTQLVPQPASQKQEDSAS